MDKSDTAFRTIGELSDELGVAPHILRYWETRFPQLRPLQRAGNRRYYRPDDVALARRIHALLNQEGYTVKGVQKLLSQRMPRTAAVAPADAPEAEPAPAPPAPAVPDLPLFGGVRALDAAALATLRLIREDLAAALDADR